MPRSEDTPRSQELASFACLCVRSLTVDVVLQASLEKLKPFILTFLDVTGPGAPGNLASKCINKVKYSLTAFIFKRLKWENRIGASVIWYLLVNTDRRGLLLEKPFCSFQNSGSV